MWARARVDHVAGPEHLALLVAGEASVRFSRPRVAILSRRDADTRPPSAAARYGPPLTPLHPAPWHDPNRGATADVVTALALGRVKTIG
jgi:hypothetical protein